ncbi:dienelactone hydrolase family protein [Corallococcus terminator]
MGWPPARAPRLAWLGGLLALLLVTGCQSASRFAPTYLLVPPEPVAVTPPLWGPLEAGPWNVGLRVRPIPPDTADASALQLTLWYPARGGDPALRVHYRDYVGLTSTEEHPEATGDARLANDAVTRYEQSLVDHGVPEESTSAWLDSPMAAVPDAPPAPGRFPLVLVAQGRDQSAHHQAVLAEYLASHGYIVATTPSTTRRAPPGPDLEVLATARAQAHALERTLRFLQSDSRIDASRVAVVGHSLGARAAFLFVLAHPESAALVSLDGGIANQAGKDWLTGLTEFHPDRYRVPLLHIHQEGDAAMVPDFGLLESLRGAERWRLRIGGMRHLDFTSVGAASVLAPGLAPAASSEGIARGWATMASATRQFLETNVRRRPSIPGAPPPPPSILATPDEQWSLSYWDVGQP